MRNNYLEVLLSLVLVVLGVLLLNPLNWFMNNMTLMLVVTALLVILGFFVAFIWRERPVDERDSKNQMYSARVAFLGGVLVLIAGIVAGAFRHQVDPWLVLALSVMVFAKLLARIYSDQNY